MSSEFFEAYKHPKWQEKRLRIMERDEFTCQNCMRDNEMLHVHHGYYIKGHKPWDYPDESLRTLCHACHLEVQELTAIVKEKVGQLNPGCLRFFLGYMNAEIAKRTAGPNCDSVIPIGSEEEAEGVTECYLTEAEYPIDRRSNVLHQIMKHAAIKHSSVWAIVKTAVAEEP